MTTEAAAQLYLAQHLQAWGNKGYAIFNPQNKPIEQLPVIYGFNNGGSRGWLAAVAIAEDGTVLGQHICSDEGYMPHDLGILKDARPDRHENDYQKHYPEGYRMDFVPYEEIENHAALQAAFKKADEMADTDTVEASEAVELETGSQEAAHD